MKWYHVASLLSVIMSIHIYSAEQVLVKPKRKSSIVTKRVRSTRSLLLMMYNQGKAKAEEIEEERDHVQDTLPPAPSKPQIKVADLSKFIKAEQISHELDLKTARSHGSSSRGSSVASSPNGSPSGSPREEGAILAESKDREESKRA